MGMRVGYARVSTVGQKLDVQLDRLSDCDRIFKEKASAATREKRPILKEALDFVRVDDVFVVTKLDRLARSVVDLSNIVQLLRRTLILLFSTKGLIQRQFTEGYNSTSWLPSVSLNVV